MAYGETIRTPRQVLRDGATGREVWKVVDWPGCHSVSTYMYCQAFSGDEKYLVFASNRTGRWELYRLDLAAEEAVQFTDYAGAGGDGDSVAYYNFHRDGREVFFDDGQTMHAVDIATLTSRVVAHRPAHWQGLINAPSFSSDGHFVACSFMDKNGEKGFARTPVSGGELTEFYRYPDPQAGISHLQVVPAAEFEVTFSRAPDMQDHPRESRENRARSWKWQSTTGQAEPFLVVPPGTRATHDYWGVADAQAADKSRRRLYFHQKWSGGLPVAIGSIAADGSDLREHYRSADRRLGHSCISPDGTAMISDVQEAGNNELIHIDLRDGTAEVLCWPNSSNESGVVQPGHVHPSFSSSARHVLFTSDASGHACVFVLPLGVEG